MSDHRTENCGKPCASGMRVRAGDGLKTALYDRCTEHCETTLLWQWDSEQNGAPMPELILGQRAKGMAAMLGGPHSENAYPRLGRKKRLPSACGYASVPAAQNVNNGENRVEYMHIEGGVKV